jgi:hypothetical protein
MTRPERTMENETMTNKWVDWLAAAVLALGLAPAWAQEPARPVWRKTPGRI